jgi:hypothetical protein
MPTSHHFLSQMRCFKSQEIDVQQYIDIMSISLLIVCTGNVDCIGEELPESAESGVNAMKMSKSEIQ